MKWVQSVVAALVLAVAGLTGTARAASYTPESGFWWNPAEPGTGLAIEIEDDFVQVAAYMYDAQGFPYWYLGAGYFVDNAGTLRLEVNTYTATGGQCLGCPWRQPVNQLVGGVMVISFDPLDETRATMTWGGQTKIIRRTDYYDLQYGNDANNQRLLGEWQVLIDFANSVGNAVSPFFGDVLIFDRIVRGSQGTGMEGCRPESLVTGFCTVSARNSHDAYAVFYPVEQLYVLTVTDLRASGQTTQFLHYIINARDFNVSEFRGVVAPALQGQNPFVLPQYRVNGYRSASRRFVQSGRGPSSIDKTTQSSTRPVWSGGRLEDNGQSQGLDVVEVENILHVDRQRLLEILGEAQLRAEARERLR